MPRCHVFTYAAEHNTDNINYTLCDNAVSTAKVRKDTYGATVYTIGIFSGANPGSDIDTNFEYGNRWDSAKQLVAANRYMHYTSCDFKDAQSMQNGGAKSGDTVTFTDMDGTVYEYTVAEVRQLEPERVEDVDAVFNDSYPLVLYTCTPGGKARVAAFCDRAS